MPELSPTSPRPLAPQALAQSMAEAARILQRTSTTAQTCDAIVNVATHCLDGVDAAGVTVVRRGAPLTAAASSEVPVRVDRLQYQAAQGPGLDAIAGRGDQATGNLAAEHDRWPDFGPRAAAETGIHSMAAVRMFVGDDTIGSLNLYAADVDAFDDTTLADAAVFAAHAALAVDRVTEHEKAENLQRALESSRHIGAAVGILMAIHHVTQEEAFDALKTVSQNSNRKLRDIADDVVVTGAMPDRAEPKQPVKLRAAG